MLKKSYLCKAISVAKFSWNKRKCLTLVEIANLKKYKQGTEQLIYVGCLSVLYIQVFGDTYKSMRKAAHFL